MKVAIARLPWVLVGIAAALEGVTVAILPFVSSLPADGPISKPPESGLLLGYIGMLTVVLLINLVGRTPLSTRIAGGALHVERPFVVAIWGGLFLALIFFFQAIFDFTPYTTVTVMLRAACSLAASTLIVLVLYRLSAGPAPWLSVRFRWGEKTWRIVATSIWVPVVLLSLYEAVALPIIEQIRGVEENLFLAGLGYGLAAGALAGLCVVALYNLMSRRFPHLRLALDLEDAA